MTVRKWNSMDFFPALAPAVALSVHGGAYVLPLHRAQGRALYVCDTAEEAAEVRRMLERHREELEALQRRFE